MKQHSLLAVVIAIWFASPCHAITINATYRDAGQSLGGFGTAGSAPSNAVGTGVLQSLVEAAVLFWQSAYLDPFTVSIEYGWFGLPSSVGTHVLLSEGGSPHRETSAGIAFDNDLSTVWFVDSTPAGASEYTTLTNYTADLGGGTMNVGREYTGGTGDAASHDLFSTVLHEFGHALGLSGANNAYVAETSGDTKIDVGSPFPYAGADLPVNAGNAHLNLDHPLMRSSRPSGVRRLASDADILANAQVSQFTNINLNAQVPEPATIVLAVMGALALLATRRRLKGIGRPSGTGVR